MYLLFYETSNKCGAVAVIGSTLVAVRSASAPRLERAGTSPPCHLSSSYLLLTKLSTGGRRVEGTSAGSQHCTSPTGHFLQWTGWILVLSFCSCIGQGGASTSMW